MGLIIFLAAAGALLTLFLLSVFGPQDRETGFWGFIARLRRVMDVCSYWFINLCGIAVILFVLYFAVKGLLRL